MAFSSIPTYSLDTCNWHQQFPSHQLANTGSSNNSPSVPPPAPPSTLQAMHASGNSTRPDSMSERARLANMPMPEASLKCPRCESTNTKFCYFNNYSLSQPRHFCKTCRRYWTRGGALRNVPVGGGCRRNNKKSNKSNKNRSKSPTTVDRQTGGGIASTDTINVFSSGGGSGGSSDAFFGLSGAVSPQFRFMAPNLVHQLGDNFGTGGEINAWNNYGNISLISPGRGENLNFHTSSHLGISPSIFSDSNPHSLGLYPYGGGSVEISALNNGGGENMFRSRLSHLSSVKMENNNQELNLSRQFLGMAENE
ncbi:hypothetical protein SAY87_024143 [Trapa incisa]|uniref:Dof zinc finger protein n=1 Tax=Trapa incisa TaxID=236973 RepID=A0AAN7L822_9MYRT|nr:hypothetical protein SAY87_024143 [Trapa incisa]